MESAASDTVAPAITSRRVGFMLAPLSNVG
jgi:hypothetical protein